MYLAEVEPLAPAFGAGLAEMLLTSCALRCDDDSKAATAISSLTDHVPFYIHHLLDEISQAQVLVTDDQIHTCFNRLLTNPQDRLDLSHYRSRLDHYYDAEHVRVALALIDFISMAPTPMPFEAVENSVNSEMNGVDSDTVRFLITLLIRDNYLRQDPNGNYGFQYTLVKKWWRLNRGLGGIQ
jgi:hypothetical protein